MKSSDIRDWVKENDVGISDTKFGMELIKYRLKNKLENVYNKYKKINGKV